MKKLLHIAACAAGAIVLRLLVGALLAEYLTALWHVYGGRVKERLPKGQERIETSCS